MLTPIELEDGIITEQRISNEHGGLDVQLLVGSRTGNMTTWIPRRSIPLWIKASTIYIMGLFIAIVYWWCSSYAHTTQRTSERSTNHTNRKRLRRSNSRRDRQLRTGRTSGLRNWYQSFQTRKGATNKDATQKMAKQPSRLEQSTTEAEMVSTSGTGEWIYFNNIIRPDRYIFLFWHHTGTMFVSDQFNIKERLNLCHGVQYSNCWQVG